MEPQSALPLIALPSNTRLSTSRMDLQHGIASYEPNEPQGQVQFARNVPRARNSSKLVHASIPGMAFVCCHFPKAYRAMRRHFAYLTFPVHPSRTFGAHDLRR